METNIYYNVNKGYTSTTIQRLKKQGWKAVKSGAIHILKDKDNKEVLTAYSWRSLLEKTEKLMR